MLENHLEFLKIIKTCPQKDLCVNVHSSIIHNSPKLEITQCHPPVKQTVIYPYNRILLSRKKGLNFRYPYTCLSLRNCALPKRETQRNTYYVNLFVQRYGTGKTSPYLQKADQWLSGAQHGGINKGIFFQWWEMDNAE